MSEGHCHLRDSSSVFDSGIYDSSTVDSLDLQVRYERLLQRVIQLTDSHSR